MLKKLLNFSSHLETVVGISLIFFPSLIINLLIDIESTETENIIGRFAGISLFCLSVACRPRKDGGNLYSAFMALLLFNFFAAVLLYYVKFYLSYSGIILLPAAILHNIIGAGLIYVYFKSGFIPKEK